MHYRILLKTGFPSGNVQRAHQPIATAYYHEIVLKYEQFTSCLNMILLDNNYSSLSPYAMQIFFF